MSQFLTKKLKWTGGGLVFGSARGTSEENVSLCMHNENSRMVHMIVQTRFEDTFLKFRLDQLIELRVAVEKSIAQLQENQRKLQENQ